MFPTINVLGCTIFVFPIILLIAFFSCIYAYMYNGKYESMYLYEVLRCLIFILPFAVIGGKILFAVAASHSLQISLIYNLLFGGFVYYGGLIGGTVGLWIYCKYRKKMFLEMTDVFFSIIPLGQGIGRIGCYLNGCCYGCVIHSRISVKYMIDGVEKRVFPTWFIESFFCFALFLIFWRFCKTCRCGFYTSAYLIYYSIFRFFIEFFRGDKIRGVWELLSTSQIISIISLIIGISIAVYIYNNSKENVFFKK